MPKKEILPAPTLLFGGGPNSFRVLFHYATVMKTHWGNFNRLFSNVIAMVDILLKTAVDE